MDSPSFNSIYCRDPRVATAFRPWVNKIREEYRALVLPQSVSFVCLVALLLTDCKSSDDPTATTTTITTTYTGTGSVTKGTGTSSTANLLVGCTGSRVAAVGTITSTDGKTMWTVPAENQFASGTKATDLYNDCSGVKLSGISALDLTKVPTTVVDTDGLVVTAYIFADNYFELYINGTLIGVDAVPYTPFNSSVLQFKVKKPYTIAVKLIDWEENLGVGTELNGGSSFYSGDGGMIAYFSDGTKTDATWKAQTFYIGPLADVSLVTEKSDGARSSSNVPSQTTCNGNCYALHWAVPTDWNSKTYSDAAWPAATLYTNTTVGVDNKPAFTNFASTWATASFIWSSNLVLDNLVLVRKTVQL
jgi:hypothetical protein